MLAQNNVLINSNCMEKPDQIHHDIDPSTTHECTLPSGNRVIVNANDIKQFLDDTETPNLLTIRGLPPSVNQISSVYVNRQIDPFDGNFTKLTATLQIPDGTNPKDLFSTIKHKINNQKHSDTKAPYCDFFPIDGYDYAIAIHTANDEMLIAFLDINSSSIVITNSCSIQTEPIAPEPLASVTPTSSENVPAESQVLELLTAVSELIELTQNDGNKLKKSKFSYKLENGSDPKVLHQAIRKVGSYAVNADQLPEQTDTSPDNKTTFSDIAGYDAQVQELCEMLDMWHYRQYATEIYGVDPPHSILIKDPDGFVAQMLAEASGKYLKSTVITVTNTDIVSPVIGESARNINSFLSDSDKDTTNLRIVVMRNLEVMINTGNDIINKAIRQAIWDKLVKPDHNIIIIATIKGDVPKELASHFNHSIDIPTPNGYIRNAVFAKLISDGTAKTFDGVTKKRKHCTLSSNPIYDIFTDDIDLPALVRLTEGLSVADLYEIIDICKRECVSHLIKTRGEIKKISQQDIINAIELQRKKLLDNS